ncbi:hypothetical protein HK104_001232 [Borealophlyctis nickersoniae]|nr:hypothetical protein HK104_001232 [Borealophlyctis nickersoniae]
MKAIAVLAVLAAAVSAQAPCDLGVFQACKNSAGEFGTSTCGPLQTGPRAGQTMPNSTVTLYDACKCYEAVQLVLCYQQCRSNTTLTTELEGQALPSQTQLCGAAQLNPARLPSPAPWQTFFPSSTTIGPTATPKASGTPTASGTTQSQGNGGFAVDATVAKFTGLAVAGLAGAVAMLL